MNGKIIAFILMGGLLGSTSSFGQETRKEKEKQERIIIRKDKGNKEKMTIVVDGDKVTINGKPVEEFSGGNVDIVSEDVLRYRIPGAPAAPRTPFMMEMPRGSFAFAGNRAVLGVVTDKVEKGAKVNEVTKDGGAEKAGIKEGDIITKVDDKEVNDENTLYSLIGKYKPDDKVTITYLRDGKKKTASVVLKKASNVTNFNRDFNFDFDMPSARMMRRPRLGMQIQDTEESNGVKVLEVEEDELAAKAGLKEGDIITEANGKAVKGIEDIREQLKDMKEGDTVKLKYKRGNNIQEAEVKFPKVLKKANL